MSELLKPDASCIVPDSTGRDMYLFAIDWRHNDSYWTVQIWAYDADDAETRVASMRQSLSMCGQIYQMGQGPEYQAREQTAH